MNDDCDGELVRVGGVALYSQDVSADREAAAGSVVPNGIRELIEATASVFASSETASEADHDVELELEPALEAQDDILDDGDGDRDADDDDRDDGEGDGYDDAHGASELATDAATDVPAISRKGVTPRVRSKRTRPRSRTIAMKRLTRAELLRGALANPPVDDVERPVTRAECRDAPRPCPWVACKHHLYLDINPRTGSIKINFPDLEPWELQHTCALDVADNGALTLEEIGTITNLTRERVRQVEVRGLLTLKARSRSLR